MHSKINFQAIPLFFGRDVNTEARSQSITQLLPQSLLAIATCILCKHQYNYESFSLLA